MVIGTGTTAFTNKANPVGAFLGDSDVQNITGAKTFSDQILKLRNPANTFTLTMKNPAITADGNTMINQPYKYLVYRDSNTVYCKNQQDGRIESSSASSVPETAIQYALDNAVRAGVYIAPGNYYFSAGFTGLTVSQVETSLIMDPGALLFVAQGYTGSMIIVPNGMAHQRIKGGRLSENGTPAKLWTAINFNSTTTGIGDCVVEDQYIRFSSTAIKLHTQGTTGPFINDCTFRNIFIDTSLNGIVFDHTSTYTDQLSGCNTNIFENIVYQGDASTVYGIKDVNGRRNMFLNCYIVDLTGAQVSCNITANSKYTQIIGGTATSLNFTDSSSLAFIRDEYQGDIVPIQRKSLSYEDGVALAAPASPATGTVRRYTKTIDANNDGRFVKERVNGAVIEVQYS